MRPNYQPKTACGGYTIIELMIVVTLIGIASSIAYGAFTGYTEKADQAAAQADMYELAQIMERAYTSDRTYADIDMTATLASFSADSRYTYSMGAAATATTYQILGVATEARGDKFDMRLNNTGVEEFRVHGTTPWDGTTGWINIKK